MSFETSPSTEALDEAMAKVQAELQAASKDKTNPHFRSSYADLASIWEACRGALTKHGVFVSQWPVHSEDDRLHIVTRLAHKGQWIQAHFSLPVTKQDAQGYGSATTYAKRYALSAAVGVAEEDDDGNAAVEKSKGRKQSKSKRTAHLPLAARVTDKETLLLDIQHALKVRTDWGRKEKKAQLLKRLFGRETWPDVQELDEVLLREGLEILKDEAKERADEPPAWFGEEAAQS